MPTFFDWRSAIRSKMKDNEASVTDSSEKKGSDADAAKNPKMPESEKDPAAAVPSTSKTAQRSETKKERILTDADWIASLGEKELKWIRKHAKSHEELDAMEVQCTACKKQVNHKQEGLVSRHPVLGVVTCRVCAREYNSGGEWTRDKDGYLDHCVWCAQGFENLFLCEAEGCKNAFCSTCIKRNLGRKAVSAIEEDDEWHCLACEPDQIRQPRALFFSIYQYWVRERAKAEKRRERMDRKKGAAGGDDSDDAVMGLLKDAEQASNILRDYISNEQRKWRRRRAAIIADGSSSDAMDEAIRRVTHNMKKIIDVTNHNLKEVARLADEVVPENVKIEDIKAEDVNSGDIEAEVIETEEAEADVKDVNSGDVEAEVVETEDVDHDNDLENGDTEMEENGPVIRTSTANGNKTAADAKADKMDVGDMSPIKNDRERIPDNSIATKTVSEEGKAKSAAQSGSDNLEDTAKARLSEDGDASGSKKVNGDVAGVRKDLEESEFAEIEARAKANVLKTSSDEDLETAEEEVKAKLLAKPSSPDQDPSSEKATEAKEEAEKEAAAKAKVLATSSSDAESPPAKSNNTITNGGGDDAEEAKAKAKVLATSSSEAAAAAEPMEVDAPEASPQDPRKKKKKTRKELDKLRRATTDGAASSGDEDGGDGASSEKKAKKTEGSPVEEDAARPKVSYEERMKRRFRKLIAAVDVRKDEKLNGAEVKVRVERLSDKVAEELKEFGEVYVKEFPELTKLLKGRKGGSKKNGGGGVSYDAEIDRLCDLAGLERAPGANSSPSKAARDRSAAGKKSEKTDLKLAVISSGEDDAGDDDNASDHDAAAGGERDKKSSNANDLARARVLASSSSGEDVEMDSDGRGGKRKKQSDGAKEKSGAKGKSGGSSRAADFIRVKLSETDSDDAQERARKRREDKDKKRKAGDDSNSDGGSGSSALGASPKKRGGKTGARRKIVSDSDESDVLEEEEEEQEDDDDDESFNDSDDSEIQVMKKAKARKRKKVASSSEDSDEADRPKKKRKRIKKNSSSEDEEENDGESPSKKGRKDIRKILSDKKVSSETKEAAVEERERRKRIEDAQKEYNEVFQIKEGETQTSLPLDYVKETKEVLVEVDKKIVKKLKPHQAGGIKFMWDAVFETKERVEKGDVPGGAILAHCMGLGKTLQTIGLIHTVHTSFESQIARVLVLCPVNTVKNWEDEFGKWLKGDLEIEVHEMSGEKDNWGRADRLGEWFREGGVMILGYDMFRNLTNEGKKFKKKQRDTFQKALVDPGPDLVVCDEGHVLKNLKSALNKAMNKITTKRRIILTGTPLQNNLSEYFAMVNFVKPNLLGTFNEFKNRFVNPIQNGVHSDSTDRDVRIMKKRSFILNDLLKGCMQRLDYNVLVPYLQPKHEYVLCINMTDFQKKLYQYYLSEFARAGQIGAEGKLEGGKKGGLFYDVQNLSRVWNHPYILLTAKERTDAKAMLDDEDMIEDEEGSLKDFIDDDDASDDATTPSDTDDDEDDDVKLIKENKKAAATRSKKTKDTDLVSGLEEVRQDALRNQMCWWDKVLEGEDYDLADIEHGSKMVLLMDILKECEMIGDKVLVFSQSLLSLDLIEQFLERIDRANDMGGKGKDSGGLDSYLGSWKHGRDYFRMDGSTGPDVRKKWCNYFNKPSNSQMRLFLISTKAGGLGINLVAANRVIIFDASWNPAHDVQSIFRVYRFGQEKPVYVYRFLAKGTMEEKIYDRQVAKQSLSARVVDEHQIERHFSMNELAELYEFNDEPESARPIPAVPKDRLLAELIQKRPKFIWRYHDHDSLLENQVDENLTEEERAAAWKEFENEKKGFMATFDHADLQG